MPKRFLSRRAVLQSSLRSVVAGTAAGAWAGPAASASPMERAKQFPLRAKTRDRVLAGHQAILDELNPSRAQLERGLELHYSSPVADMQGNVSVTYEGGLIGDRLAASKGLDPFKARTFESAFDPQWIAESRALYAIAGVQVASEDVAHPGENDFDSALRLLARSNYVYDRRPDLVRVGGWDDVEQARREGKVSVIAHLAGVGCFAETDDPLANLDLFYLLGVRMSQLTYIQKNKLCSSWFQEEDTGLTELGRRVVRRMNQLGIMVDLAHCGPRSALEAVDVSTEPVIVSHTGCQALYDHRADDTYVNVVLAQPYARGVARPRKTSPINASDELLRAVAKKGGVVGLFVMYHLMAKDSPSFAGWWRHMEHLIHTVGIDHAAVGSDFGFLPGWKTGPLDWTNWPYWTVGLVCRGLSDEEIRKIIGGNYLRYAKQVLNKRPWGDVM
jgi:membrane dipeptidase